MLFKDQLNQTITLRNLPKRIVSLVPSQTELLFDLGLEHEIIGITKYCLHPAAKVKQKMLVGGTKNFDIELIKQLNPDLIIGNKEENEQTGIETLKNFFPVWMSDIATLEDAIDMILKVGTVVGKAPLAQELAANIQKAFATLAPNPIPLKTVAYFIWRKPLMVAASATFIDDMLRRAGFSNVFQSLSRYPIITSLQLKQADPDFIFLSSEPYPFREKHLTEFRSLCPNAKILLVNGELFSWYGSRLQSSPAYFSKLAPIG